MAVGSQDLGTELLTVEETAGELRVSVPTVYRIMRSGRLKFTRVGGRRRIPRREVVDYLRSEEKAQRRRR
jgi:excisionase family DNA binding protein